MSASTIPRRARPNQSSTDKKGTVLTSKSSSTSKLPNKLGKGDDGDDDDGNDGKPRPFKCPICGRTFTRKEHLDRHLKTIHSNDKPFKCMYNCKYQCSRKDNLRQHVQSKHKVGEVLFEAAMRAWEEVSSGSSDDEDEEDGGGEKEGGGAEDGDKKN